MPNGDFYYATSGRQMALSASTDTLAVGYRDQPAPRDLDSLIRDDEQLQDFVLSRVLLERNIVLFKRRPSVHIPLEQFADRVRQSQRVAYVTRVFLRGGRPVIVRDRYVLRSYELTENRCGHCNTTIPGVFERAPGNWGRRRKPIVIEGRRTTG